MLQCDSGYSALCKVSDTNYSSTLGFFFHLSFTFIQIESKISEENNFFHKNNKTKQIKNATILSN